MKKLLFLMILLAGSTVYASTNLNFFQARIHNINRQHLIALTQNGITIDNVRDNEAIIYLRSDQLSVLENMGISYDIRPPVRNANGYHSIESLADHLQSVETNHPDICKLYSIGKSYEGRDLWFMKISDNVLDEEDEPEVKYISSMHGDEPVGMELCLHLIDYLSDNYNVLSNTTDLINNLEIWIMPLMNPDGYVHQQRYNMQGIDLNRDFPDRVSSNHNTTEGRAVETAHVMNWAFAHSSVLSANFHTGALLVNYPYDSDYSPSKKYSATPDDELFQKLSLSYSSLNPPMYNSPYFDRGITNGVQWYYAYGGMQDWNYIWLGCNEVTIELSDDKWPSFSTINSFWDDNQDAMLNYISWALRGIRGVITDSETNMPIDAVVRIIGIDHDIYTDPDVGDYHRILLPGIYDIEFSAEGYLTKRKTNIVVTDGNAARLDIRLTHQSCLNTIESAIIILKAMSGVAVDDNLLRFDINDDGTVGLMEAIYAMRLSANSISQ